MRRPIPLVLAVVLSLLPISPGAGPDDSTSAFTLARLKYDGGGDWYNGPTEVPNLLAFIRRATPIAAAEEEARVEIMDEDLFTYPMLYLTGHGNVRFTEEEVRRLRLYLEHGGFLLANDDYGLDAAFRREIGKVFPDKRLAELPPGHGIFREPFSFPNGLPKIHEHDNGRPQAFGIFHDGRLVVLYCFESDIGDGWDDPDVHGDPLEKREAALKMGTNIVVWVLSH